MSPVRINVIPRYSFDTLSFKSLCISYLGKNISTCSPVSRFIHSKHTPQKSPSSSGVNSILLVLPHSEHVISRTSTFFSSILYHLLSKSDYSNLQTSKNTVRHLFIRYLESSFNSTSLNNNCCFVSFSTCSSLPSLGFQIQGVAGSSLNPSPFTHS